MDFFSSYYQYEATKCILNKRWWYSLILLSHVLLYPNWYHWLISSRVKVDLKLRRLLLRIMLVALHKWIETLHQHFLYSLHESLLICDIKLLNFTVYVINWLATLTFGTIHAIVSGINMAVAPNPDYGLHN